MIKARLGSWWSTVGTMLVLGACGGAERAEPDAELSSQTGALGASGPVAGEFVLMGNGNRCMATENGNTRSPIYLYDCHNADTQRFNIVPVNWGEASLRTMGKCVDVTNGVFEPGTALQLYDCAWAGAQHFKVVPRGTGFEIQSAPRLHLCIGARSDGTANQTRLELQTCDGSAKQRFSLTTAQKPDAPPVAPAVWTSGRTLTIEDRSFNEHGFRVYGRPLRQDGNLSDFQELKTLGAQAKSGMRNTATAPQDAAGKPYEFRVVAHNSFGESSTGVITGGPQRMLPVSSCVLHASQEGKASVWLEAEMPERNTGFHTGYDQKASGGRYLTTPEFTLRDDVPSGAGRIESTYTFSVPVAGDYVVWARGKVSDDSSDSFWFQIDGKGATTTDPWWRWNLAANPAWTWSRVTDGVTPLRATLGAGTHTLTVAKREDGSMLDALVITSKSSVTSESFVGCSALTETRTQVVDSTLTCAADSITSSEHDPICDGPWQYYRNPACLRRDESCGLKECLSRPDCRHLDNGWVWQTEEVDTHIRNVHMHCEWPDFECGPGTGSPQCPIPTCWALDDVQALCKKEAEAYNNTENTDQTPASLHGLIKYELRVWHDAVDNREGTFKCKGKVTYPVVNLAYNVKCPCANEPYVSCMVPHQECGVDAGQYYSQPGLKRSEIIRDDAHYASHKQPTCMSCDTKLMNTGAEVREKFRCLSDQFSILRTQEPGTPNQRPGHGDWTAEDLPMLAARMRVIYELRGEDLSADQRTVARELYYRYPSSTLACGSDDDLGDSIDIAPTCAGAAELSGHFDRCDELTGDGVSGGLAAAEALSCVKALNDLALVAADGTNCVSADALQRAATIVEKVMIKAMGTVRSDPAKLGKTERVLYKIDQFYEAAVAAQAALAHAPLEGEVLEDDDTAFQRLGRVQGHMWKYLQNLNGLFDDLADSDNLEEDIKIATERGLAMDRSVLSAAFRELDKLPEVKVGDAIIEPEISLNRGPIRGVALLSVVGDSLGAVTRRMRDLTAMHSFACQFKSCKNRVTPLSAMWSLMAAMDDTRVLGTRLATVPNTLDSLPGLGALEGWKATFQLVHDNHDAFVDALAQVRQSGDAAGVRSLDAIVGEYLDSAKRVHAAYTDHGLLDPMAIRTIFAGQLALDREQAVQRRRADAQDLKDAIDGHRANLAILVDRALEVHSDSVARSAIASEQARLSFEAKNVRDDIIGLQASSGYDRKRLGEIGDSFASIDDAIDDNQFFKKGTDTKHVSLSARDAQFRGFLDTVLDVDSDSFQAEPGEMVVVQMQPGSEWSPSCALSGTQIKDPSMDGIKSIGNLEGFIGPEGYRIVRTQSGFDAYAFNDTYSESAFVEMGVKAEVCHSWKYPVDTAAVNSASGSECVYFQAGLRAEDGWNQNYSHGWENRTSASFAGGLRLPFPAVPFPAYPVGALLLVEMPRTEKQLPKALDVHIVNGHSTTVLVDQPADFYFVINDRHCANANNTHHLEMDVVKLTSMGTEAPKVIEAMRKTLTDVRSNERQLVAQGRILPSQLAAIRSAVELSLQSSLSYPVDSLPTPLLTLFRAFLDKEIVEFERATEISQLVREERRLTMKLEDLDEQLADIEKRGRIAQLLPAWTLQNIDGEGVRETAAVAIEGFRKFVYPILELWYPRALAQLADDTAPGGVQAKLQALLDAPLGSKTLDLASTTWSVMDTILRKYLDAPPGFGSADGIAPLVLAHPNPCAANDSRERKLNALSELPKSESNWQESSAGFSRAKHVWEKVYTRDWATFQINPQDVYLYGGGSAGYVTCALNTPVIQRMAIVVIKQGGTAGSNGGGLDQLNQGRWLAGKAVGEQPFVTARETINYKLGHEHDLEDEPVDYTIGTPLEFEVPLIYVNYNTPMSEFERWINARPLYSRGATGISPFSKFEVNFARFAQWVNTPAGDGLSDAMEIALVTVVEGRRGANITRLTSCSPEYVPADIHFDNDSFERPAYCPARPVVPCTGNDCRGNADGGPEADGGVDGGVEADGGVSDGGFLPFPDLPEMDPTKPGTKPGKGPVISDPWPTPNEPEAM